MRKMRVETVLPNPPFERSAQHKTPWDIERQRNRGVVTACQCLLALCGCCAEDVKQQKPWAPSARWLHASCQTAVILGHWLKMAADFPTAPAN